MKKQFIVLVFAIVCCFGCKKDTAYTYASADNIYLDYPNLDGLSYSFSDKPNVEKDTIWIPVKIAGVRANQDRKFVMTVVEEASSAVRGFHFEMLKPFYIMPKDSGTVRVPVIIKNIDTGLVSKSVALTIRVDAGADFRGELPASKRTKTITFSNRLEEPSWWKYWGQLRGYSRTKHQLFMIVNGNAQLVDLSLPNAFYEIPRTLYYIENMRVFVTYPLTWVSQNASKGYAVKLRTDGTGDYDFYNIAAPTKTFHLKYFAAANEYVFLDEKGDQIKM